jgi:hypothetical protein
MDGAMVRRRISNALYAELYQACQGELARREAFRAELAAESPDTDQEPGTERRGCSMPLAELIPCFYNTPVITHMSGNGDMSTGLNHRQVYQNKEKYSNEQKQEEAGANKAQTLSFLRLWEA